MTCERKEHMLAADINPIPRCIKCNPNIETGECIALERLQYTIAHLARCSMEGHPKIVEAP